MRKLLIILFLAFTSLVQGQADYFTIPKGDGTLIGMVKAIGPVNPNGSKNPAILWVHGQEGNGTNPFSSGDTSRIDNVVLKGTTKLVINGPLPYFQIPGTTGAEGLRRFNVYAAQNRTGLWDCVLLEKAIEYIIANRVSENTDTSLIVMFGYSLGGGGCQSCLRMPGIQPYIKYVAIIAPGYLQTADYALLASAAIPIDMFAAVNDELAPPTGAGRADAFVQGIKAQNPIVVPNFWRFADLTASTSANAEHNRIVQIIAEDTTAGDTYLQTNGDTWVRTETIYQRALRFGGPRRKHNALLWFFIPSIWFKRQRTMTTTKRK